ncbi:50S ribosomal protein L15e [Candidatus Pacearchaeota archaeon RBG_13_33_26]|nr:MAG: 50S ribosomal protein L15e [Candidatus Pacearchaeota archaeon RBG_13_33_26]
MAQGMYHYIQQAWKKPDAETLRKRMVEWRHNPAFTRVEKPLRLDKARALGYKDKKGFVIVRVRIKRGGHKRPRPNKGRRGKRMHIRKNLQMNYKGIAEQRTARKYENLEVLNSYPIGKDGVNYFFEIILVNPNMPEIKNDKTINWICNPKNKKRALRGLTSSAKKSRGLRHHQRRKKGKNIRRSMAK